MPPPPVAGAAEGTGLADGTGVADGTGLADGTGVADGTGLADGTGVADGTGLADGTGVADGTGLADGTGVADGLAEGLPLAAGPVRLAVPLGGLVGATDPVDPGENAGAVGGGDPEQAETDAAARMVTVAQPTAANLVLSPAPAMVTRIFTGPPGGL